MAETPQRPPLLRRWRAWLPPILVVAAILVVLLLLGPGGSGAIFRYKFF